MKSINLTLLLAYHTMEHPFSLPFNILCLTVCLKSIKPRTILHNNSCLLIYTVAAVPQTLAKETAQCVDFLVYSFTCPSSLSVNREADVCVLVVQQPWH